MPQGVASTGRRSRPATMPAASSSSATHQRFRSMALAMRPARALVHVQRSAAAGGSGGGDELGSCRTAAAASSTAGRTGSGTGQAGAALTTAAATTAAHSPSAAVAAAAATASLEDGRRRRRRGGGVREAVGSPAFTAAALGGFALLAAAVTADDSPLLRLDAAAHAAVVSASAASAPFRVPVARLLSNSFIEPALLGWLACSAACLVRAPRRASLELLAVWLAYPLTCGAMGHANEARLVDALKHAFARLRPSGDEYYSSFSFPSGHTSAAVFLTASLLLVLLPLALRDAGPSCTAGLGAGCAEGRSEGAAEASGADELPAAGAAAESSAGSASSFWQPQMPPDSWLLGCIAASWGVTATGRVLADVHWVTDTLAGGCLGLACTSALLQLTSFLAKWPEEVPRRNNGAGHRTALSPDDVDEAAA